MIATAEKDWERAEKYFRQSIAFLSSAHQFHLAETYFEMALMYEHKGECDRKPEQEPKHV